MDLKSAIIMNEAQFPELIHEKVRGLGMEFTAVAELDCAHLAALMMRVRGLSRAHGKPQELNRSGRASSP